MRKTITSTIIGAMLASAAIGSPAFGSGTTKRIRQSDRPFVTCATSGAEAKADADNQQCRAVGVGPSTSIEVIREQIRRTRRNVISLRNGLERDIGSQRSIQTVFDSGQISLGIASVAAAFARLSSPWIGGLAIAAGSGSEFRSYYNPSKKGLDLIKAIQATRCVATKAEMLSSAQVEEQYAAITRLRRMIALVERSTFLADRRASTAADAEVLRTADDAADAALTNARKALVAINTEVSAYAFAPAAIDEAHDAIKTYLDKVRHRDASPDASAVAGRIQPMIDAATASAVKVQVAREQMIAAFKAEAIAAAVAKANGGAPAAAGANAVDQVIKGADATTPPTDDKQTQNGANAAATAPANAATTAAPTVDSTLASMKSSAMAAAANTPATKAAATSSAAVGAAENTAVVSALNRATEDALGSVPAQSYTTINAMIGACTAVIG